MEQLPSAGGRSTAVEPSTPWKLKLPCLTLQRQGCLRLGTNSTSTPYPPPAGQPGEALGIPGAVGLRAAAEEAVLLGEAHEREPGVKETRPLPPPRPGPCGAPQGDPGTSHPSRPPPIPHRAGLGPQGVNNAHLPHFGALGDPRGSKPARRASTCRVPPSSALLSPGHRAQHLEACTQGRCTQASGQHAEGAVVVA